MCMTYSASWQEGIYLPLCCSRCALLTKPPPPRGEGPKWRRGRLQFTDEHRGIGGRPTHSYRASERDFLKGWVYFKWHLRTNLWTIRLVFNPTLRTFLPIHFAHLCKHIRTDLDRPQLLPHPPCCLRRSGLLDFSCWLQHFHYLADRSKQRDQCAWLTPSKFFMVQITLDISNPPWLNHGNKCYKSRSSVPNPCCALPALLWATLYSRWVQRRRRLDWLLPSVVSNTRATTSWLQSSWEVLSAMLAFILLTW